MVTRRSLVLGCAATGAAILPAIARGQTFETDALHRSRATVAVMVNDRGPLRFAVDTAANSSVLASDLVEPLGLAPAGEIGMHTLVGREVVQAVRARRLSSGVLDARDVRLAVGRRAAIAGLDGLLGCDLLKDRRLILNFRGGESIRIARSRAHTGGFLDPVQPRTHLFAAGQQRFGNLLMIPARVGTSRAVAIIDSGAEGTILNQAAATAGRATPLALRDGQTRTRVQSPTGASAPAESQMLRSLRFAGVSLTNVPVTVGDFHTFSLWGLADEPAVLIGLDVLRLFAAVHIDLKRSEFSLRV